MGQDKAELYKSLVLYLSHSTIHYHPHTLSRSLPPHTPLTLPKKSVRYFNTPKPNYLFINYPLPFYVIPTLTMLVLLERLFPLTHSS
jgi:hypothetical protein